MTSIVSMVALVLLAGGSVALLVLGVWQFLSRRKTLVMQRLDTYTSAETPSIPVSEIDLKAAGQMPHVMRLLLGQRYVERVQDALARADVAMHPWEYFLARLGLAAVGFVVGLVGTSYVHSGAVLAVFGFLMPAIVVRIQQNRRREKFVRQLADALMLQINSLRAGYGFLKGLELIAKEMDDPMAKELNRTLREVNLGSTIEQALVNLGRRINSRDLDIVISAYLIQKDVGGNLSEIMEHVADTIRERLQLRGEIRTLTAHGRLSGMIVGLLPVGVCLFFILKTPDYFAPMLGEPFYKIFGLNVPLGVLLLVLGLIWQLIGAYLINRIINIKI